MDKIMYKSTRNDQTRVTSSQAILSGLAPDGGLYVPECFPTLDISLSRLAEMSYKETAYEVMKLFLTDFTEEELKDCIRKAYDAKFDTSLIAPMKKCNSAWYLELFHGQTIAFKDMALSILPHLLTTAARKCGESRQIVILTATSGDTGKAALAGFADVPGTRIMVFYPKNGVSPIQEKQMMTQKGKNVFVAGIRGNFDDAQSMVKQLFTDPDLRSELEEKGYRFSSANSINIGRLIPQVVYYVYAYGQLIREHAVKAGEAVNFTVPTGNFGNILAAYYASRIGIPVKQLICASNENKVLFDFFKTGIYDRNREFLLTTSPSMDILISSNLERMIYEAAGEDAKICRGYMDDLAKYGRYEISPQMKKNLEMYQGGFATVQETASRIREIFENEGYLLDPHTAVASFVYDRWKKESGDTTPTVIVSTASPYKFTRSVMEALGTETGQEDDFVLADRICELTGIPIPAAVSQIRDAEILHDRVINRDEMEDAVRGFLS